jgi:protein-S-isoprenylcysteine O-methyltransferase Ste14
MQRDKTLAISLAVAYITFESCVVIFFAFFVWSQGAALIQTLRISTLIILIKAALDLRFYIRKYTTAFVSTSAYAWLIALGGTLAPLLLRPSDERHDVRIATAIQIIGLLMQIYLLRTLGDGCENALARRAIKRDGLYRFVRHPLHVSFIISLFGYVLNQTTFYNLFILALAIGFQVLRINEEEHLLRRDEAYQEYAQRTPWRILPGGY